MINGDPKKGNFFEQNKEHDIVTEFTTLVRKYGKDTASDILWSIWYVYHPSSSIFDMDINDKQQWVKDNFYKGINWTENIVVEAIKTFPKVAMTPQARHYHFINMIYEQAKIDSLDLEPSKRLALLKTLNSAAKEVEIARKSYEESIMNKIERSIGSNQSGFISHI